ncbi:MAG: enoyl-CoA hydratase/isomerase family protein [Acidobacteria bacterium]|nr:enoyl-CoA hydratase/isomerase family protein [Acidobacteriota bacterium]
MSEIGGVTLTLDGASAIVTFEHPPVSTLDRHLVMSLEEKVREAARRRETKLITLASKGHDFSAGLEANELVPERADLLIKAFHSLVRLLLTIEVPTMALVQGRALGGGAELALACDFVFAETTATFGFPEIRLGLFPPVASVLLERRIGRTKVADLVLCGAAVNAEAAERRWMINALVNPGDLVNALELMHERLQPFSASSLRMAKRALALGGSTDPIAGLALVERVYLKELMSTRDAAEGVEAFLEKRGPVWKDR